MTTAQYINQAKTKQAQKAKRLMMMHLKLPQDRKLKAELRQAVQIAERQRLFAEANLSWSLLEL